MPVMPPVPPPRPRRGPPRPEAILAALQEAKSHLTYRQIAGHLRVSDRQGGRWLHAEPISPDTAHRLAWILDEEAAPRLIVNQRVARVARSCAPLVNNNQQSTSQRLNHIDNVRTISETQPMDTKTKRLELRISPEEKRQISRRAAEAGYTMSAWIRAIVVGPLALARSTGRNGQ